MATWDAADPRWKVKDMGDAGKNVNSWHWTETDALPWFKREFEECFNGDENVILSEQLKGGSGLTGELIAYKLETCTGEAQVTRRKGNKVMLLYEIELKVKWQSKVKDAEGKEVSTSKGNFNIPNLDTVDEIDEFDINVKFNKDNAEVAAANKFAKEQGSPKVRALIVDLIKKLQAEAGVGQKVPKDGATPDSSPVPAASAAAAAPKAAAAAAPPAEKKVEKKSSVSSDTVEVTCTFAAPAKEVFECFVVQQRVSAYTQSRAEVGTAAGSKLVLFDGAITGETVSCDAPKKLVWLWRQSAWPEGKMSTATLNFDETSPGNTVVTLTQTNVPSSDVHGNSNMKEVVADGWKRNIFDRIKMVFGYGAPSFS